jgi:hypothetical protein
MDERFQYFLANMRPRSFRREVPLSGIEKYQEHLPDLLLTHWKDLGWSGYGDGIFWTVNPDEYHEVIQAWLEESGIENADTYHFIARGGFGNLYLWQSHTGNRLNVNVIYARYLLREQSITSREAEDQKVHAFFATVDRKNNDVDDLFEQARKKLGPLQPDEMYGFVPAIALGGPGTLNTLQKVKSIEHLTLLSQLSPLTDWGFPNINDL